MLDLSISVKSQYFLYFVIKSIKFQNETLKKTLKTNSHYDSSYLF